MMQIVFRLPGLNLPIYGYGVMLVIAFLACVQVSKRMALRKGLDPEIFINAALIALVTGVAGARISHVLENFATYTNPERSAWDNFADAINIRSGGLTFYGGFILATPCCIWYALKNKMPLLASMDIVAPVLMVGLGFGRIGCYLNGCCYGEICNPAFAQSLTTFPYRSNPYIEQFDYHLIAPPPQLLTDQGTLKDWDEIHREGLDVLANAQKALPVQPTQLYSSFTAFLLAGLLIAFWTLPHLDGRVFALMMMLEGPARFLLEMIRVEPAVVGRMSLSMLLGLVVFAAGVIMWCAIGATKKAPWEPTLAVA
jgi:phosphatidylglycerol:prolipoprotein diacylglycerol transferase